MSKKWLVAVVVGLCVWYMDMAVVSADEYDRKSLRGLEGVQVAVEDMNPDAEADGLTQRELQIKVELNLRMAGIRVLTAEESLNTVGMPYLYVRVNTYKNVGMSLYAVSVEVYLNQNVALLGEEYKVVSATTWRTACSIGTVGQLNLRTVIEDVEVQVDDFINDYLAANPKERENEETER